VPISKKHCKLTDQGYKKINQILQFEKTFDEAEGNNLFKNNGKINISTLAIRTNVDRETATKIMTKDTVGESSLQKFITALRDKHKDSKEVGDDYDLIETEDYIMCDQSSNPTRQNLSKTRSEQLKTALFNLNYKSQVRAFEDQITETKTGAFLIYGQENHGQKWLVHRLCQQIPYCINAEKKAINLKHSRHYQQLNYLWQDLGQALGINNYNCDSLSQAIAQYAQTSTLILCFHNIEILTNSEREQFIADFWQKVVNNAQNIKFPIVLFLTANEEVNISFQNDYFFILEKLQCFEVSEINHWITTNTNLFTQQEAKDSALKNMINDIIIYHNQTPETALSKITAYSDFDFTWFDLENNF
jgi:hypothetical protein